MIFSQIKEALKKKDFCIISGFGSFKVAGRNAGIGINPKSGGAIQINEMNVVKFTAGKVLKEDVNSVND